MKQNIFEIKNFKKSISRILALTMFAVSLMYTLPVFSDGNSDTEILPGEETPKIAIDYKNEKLINFEVGTEYTINGKLFTPKDSELSAVEYMGETLNIIKKASDSAHSDSLEQILSIPTRPNTKWAKPVMQLITQNGVQCVETVRSPEYEYTLDGGKTWFVGDGINYQYPVGSTIFCRLRETENSFRGYSCIFFIQRDWIDPEPTPIIEIDYQNERLTGFISGDIYSLDGFEVSLPSSSIPIDSSWFGMDKFWITKCGKDNATSTRHSETLVLNIPKHPEGPNAVGGENIITGVSSDMEYRVYGENTWKEISGDALTGIEPGKYEVRYKSTTSDFASRITEVKVTEALATPSPSPTAEPTTPPTASPSAEPTMTPSAEPTSSPTAPQQQRQQQPQQRRQQQCQQRPQQRRQQQYQQPPQQRLQQHRQQRRQQQRQQQYQRQIRQHCQRQNQQQVRRQQRPQRKHQNQQADR